MSMHLHQLFAVFAAILILSACGGRHDDDVPVVGSTILSAREQVPVNASTALASGTVTVDEDRRMLIASVYTDALAGTEVHLHNAPPGSDGLIVIALTRVASSAVWEGSVVLTEAQWESLLRGNFYFDIHTAAYPAGEVRGQVFDAFPPDEHVAALLQLASQSPLLAEQLRQLEDYEDWWHGDHTGVGIGLSFGF